ncbi:hypothetical protein [Caldimonas sp. KR1-144]|uniref:hypothetical protein n=1 Tax=Caldimonas sp. KR1-144 TaxID=3400911 RepID=UPI003C11CA51
MSTLSIRVPRNAAPRGADPLAGLFVAAYTWASNRLVEYKAHRAERTAQRTAFALRRAAEELQWSQPGFASDLRAVAERYENSLDR